MNTAFRVISVVIPTLNEATALPETVRRLRGDSEIAEIIVVDGGSRDATPAVAKQLGCVVLSSAPGRGTQMRAGAAIAQSPVVLLLHADTWVSPGAGRALLDRLSQPGVAAAGFWKEFRDPPLLLLGSKIKCAIRLWLGRRIAGDQGLALRRDLLEQIGGVPDVPLMEEFELCAILARRGRLVLADSVVQTSARRFIERGIIRTYLRMWHVTLLYWLGATPAELKKLYERR